MDKSFMYFCWQFVFSFRLRRNKNFYRIPSPPPPFQDWPLKIYCFKDSPEVSKLLCTVAKKPRDIDLAFQQYYRKSYLSIIRFSSDILKHYFFLLGWLTLATLILVLDRSVSRDQGKQDNYKRD